MANFLDESRLIWKTGRARKVSIDVENHFSNVFKAINAMAACPFQVKIGYQQH